MPLHLRGIVQSARLEENPPGSDTIEMIVKVQGVGPGQPRTLVVPFHLLLQDPSLEPESVQGRGFEADADQAADGRWVLSQLALAPRRVLRDQDPSR